MKFGGGKVIRDGMGQSQVTNRQGAADTVITNALIVDHWGIVKADVAIKEGYISAIGKAGNPDIQPGVTIVIGPGTDVIAGEGKILTAGGFDSHIHFICPQQIEHALMSGVTSMLGGGTGPSHGTFATTCTPGPWHMARMIQSFDAFPVNLGISGKGNASRPAALVEMINAGACALKLHEDWGTTPAAINNCLSVADDHDVQVMIHSDTLNEFGFRRGHRQGLQGPHHSRLPHRRRRRRPCARHHQDCRPEERAAVFDQSDPAVHPQHHRRASGHADGVPPSRSLDCRGSGVRGKPHPQGNHRGRRHPARSRRALDDVVGFAGHGPARRSHHPYLADRRQDEEAARLAAEDKGNNDNFRVKRYIAKYTINPAIAHGVSKLIGSVEKGKLADLVLWSPAFFGVKPECIIKGGSIVAAPMGDPNASIPTPQPVHYQPMFAAFGKSLTASSVVFSSKAAVASGLAKKLGIDKKLYAVENTRGGISKKSMIHNGATPKIEVDPETYEVRADGELLTCAPAEVLPMAQRYFMF